MKRTLIIIFAFFFCASLLSAQSLVELSKREKARRASLKKRAKVVTNIDLQSVIRTSGVIITPPAPPEGEVQVEGEEPVQGEQPPAAQEEAPPQEEPVPDELEEAQEAPDMQDVLAEKWRKAIEYRELLNLKMNALMQEFNSMNDMTPREDIQRQIAETNKALEQAKKDEESAKREYELFLRRR
jgi:hypothetical protein